MRVSLYPVFFQLGHLMVASYISVCTVVFWESCFQPYCSHLSFYQSHRQGSFIPKKVGFGTSVVIHEGVI